MIWVFLDESSATGTHEFADSVNNGPWGQALTTELIPYLESHYRMDADVQGRFLNGHSSGGWATLWLQTRYPKIFGGTWSTSPDPSDFHDFTGAEPLRAARQRVSQGRWYALAVGARQRKGAGYVRAVREDGTCAGSVRRPAGLVRLGVLAAR